MNWNELELHDCASLNELINEVGFLPLLATKIEGWSAEEVMDDDCRYHTLPDGGWEWPLWDWKGSIIQETGCAYGKFFGGKAGFISREWWPDFCNWRRYLHPHPVSGSIEEAILLTLGEGGSMTTRELRVACGFTGPKMRSKFDAYITHLQMGCYIVTEDFVYPHDKHGRSYGWGWSLLTLPENLLGREACHKDCSLRESFLRLKEHLRETLPQASESQLCKILEVMKE